MRRAAPRRRGASARRAGRVALLGVARWVPLSMAATLVLAVAGVFLYGLQGGVEALAAQLAVDHVKCFEFAPQPTVLPDARALGREWAAARGWTIKVPDERAARAARVARHAPLHLDRGHHRARDVPMARPAAVGVRAEQRAPARRRRHRSSSTSSGQEAIIWSKGGRTYAVVARGRPADIEQVARYVAEPTD